MNLAILNLALLITDVLSLSLLSPNNTDMKTIIAMINSLSRLVLFNNLILVEGQCVRLDPSYLSAMVAGRLKIFENLFLEIVQQIDNYRHNPVDLPRPRPSYTQSD